MRQKRIKAELYGESFIVERAGEEELFVKNIYIFPFSKEQITGVILRIDDVTELAKKEEQLDRAKKAEALGTMAGGLAHHFNNIITRIVSTASYLDVIMKGGGDTDEIQSHLSIIRRSGEKAAGLVKNLMSFSKGNRFEHLKVDLDNVISEVSGIASATIKDIELTVDAVSGNKYVSGDHSQLEQVILNLIVNASEAIKQSNGNGGKQGRISLMIKKTDPGDKPLTAPAGYLWLISISDNGPGIEKEHLASVFDPFFTTKKDGNGLGLAIVNTIITRHEGLIEVHSQQGEGTVFNIYLPAIE